MRAIGDMASGGNERAAGSSGLGAWLLERLRGRRQAQPRLALLERIVLAPRQSLALIEVEGRRILVATSAEGGPAFFPLGKDGGSGFDAGANVARRGRSRASW